MPSKYSENLKQAIQYIRAGEMEIAREIILEIIQNDPDYEKAWIWLSETVTDKAGKVEILKTRLDEYPDSPLTRKALERLAPEILDHLQKEEEAVFVPPSARIEPKQDYREETIRYDISSEDMGEDRFGFDDDDLIEFEEPEKDDDVFTGAGIFGADTDSGEPSEFDLLLQDEEDGEDADEVLEQDLEAFLRGDLAAEDTEGKKTSKSNSDMTFTDWLQGEEENDTEEKPVDELSFLMAQETNADQNQDADQTSASNPFVLSREESLALFGEDVINEKKDRGDGIDSLRPASTGDSKSAFHNEDIDTFGFDEEPFPELDPSSGTSVSADDLLDLQDNLRTEVVRGTPRKQGNQPLQPAGKAQKKKKPNKNSTFIWGCTVLAVIIIIALLGMAWLYVQNIKNNPPGPTATMTIAPSATATEEYTLVAPWLEDTTPTPTPEGE